MNCESCGMPMKSASEHGGGEESNPWCAHCCNTDGSHKSREEVRRGMVEFALSEDGKRMLAQFGISSPKSTGEAENYVDAYMATLPAWKGGK